MNSKACLPLLVLLLVVPLSVNSVPMCNAQINSYQTPNLQISYDMYNWTVDMNRISMMTPATGLVFKVTIYNNDTAPLLIGYSSWNSYYTNSYSETSLTIIIQVQSPDNQYLTQGTQTISFSYNNELYLPPNTSESFFVEFDNYGNNVPIGSYTAKVSYYLNTAPNYGINGVLIGATPIGQYPFNFQVESQKTLDNAIAQNPNPQVSHGSNLTATSVILIVAVSVIVAVVLSVGLTYIIFTRTRFKEKFGDETKKRQYQFFGSLATVLSLIFSFIAIYIAYLQLIKT